MARGNGRRWPGYFPGRFADNLTETSFLNEFRTAGLSSTLYACCVAIVGYVLIGVVEIAFDGWSAAGALRRLLLVVLLSLIVILIALRPGGLLRRYSAVFGTLVGVAYVCSVSVTHFFRDDDPTAVVNPTALIGLWMIYGFVRLPLQVAISIGVIGGCFALFGSRVTNMADPAVRTAVYLLLGNALGITLSRSIELRERQLFLQKESLEKAQLELRRRSQTAEEGSAEKTRLVAAVGHDLRQPMMAARLHLSVLMQRVLAGDADGAKHQAARVEQSVQLLGDTLEHLLLASRYDAGTEPINIQAVPLVEILRTLLHLCEPQATEQRVSLIIRMPRSGVQVMTDERILLRALVNLVTNAVKFAKPSLSEAPSRVVVRTAHVGARCKISVLDNGIGIATSDLEAIWEPFFQIGNKERNRESGIGLGLFLVRQSLRLLDEHQVSVTSTLGRGTHFRIILPGEYLHDPRTSSERFHLSEGPAASGLGEMYVLVVEDDHEAREALEAQLDAWGVLYTSGSRVEELLPEVLSLGRHVDAILADFRLPGGTDGVSAISIARAQLGYCPEAVLITAEVDVLELARMLPVNCSLIRKPFEPMLLYRTLGSVSGRGLPSLLGGEITTPAQTSPPPSPASSAAV
jgi:signal transduction histidine kinase/CheY-like chemotaxis protein